jgi:biopolymer transport protein ExbD
VSGGWGQFSVCAAASNNSVRLEVERETVEAVAPDELKGIFERAQKKDPETQVVVQADEATHHGRVDGVMELAKTAGLHRLAIATRRAPGR